MKTLYCSRNKTYYTYGDEITPIIHIIPYIPFWKRIINLFNCCQSRR